MAAMPNIAALLKSEISRVARKEVRGETLALKKAARNYRSEIAALKRRTQELEHQVRRLRRSVVKAIPAESEAPSTEGLRFSAKGLISQRKRLGLSAAECGLLVGASAQSIYNWEEGKVCPRAKHLLAIAGLRAMGKREAAARLAAA
jgi:DNA-binding XRE family transcriptional regulator